MGEHEAARARPDRGGDRLQRRVVGVGLDVDVDRHEALLVDGRDRRREADGGGDHLVAGAQRTLVQMRRRRRDRQQVRLRSGADQQRVVALGRAREAGAELGGEAALGEVGVQDRGGGRDQVRGVEDLRRHRHARAPGRERLGLQRRLGVAPDGGERLLAQRVDAQLSRPAA